MISCKLTNKINKLNDLDCTILNYTIYFTIAILLVYNTFWRHNLAFVWNVDGVMQNFSDVYEERENY